MDDIEKERLRWSFHIVFGMFYGYFFYWLNFGWNFDYFMALVRGAMFFIGLVLVFVWWNSRE